MTESLRAARHAVTLGSALAVTSVIALCVRLLLPRMLGPEAFGQLRLAESFAEMLFVVLTLGVDQHLRQHAAVDPTGARQYLTGLSVWRLGLAILTTVTGAWVLHLTGASTDVVTIFAALAVAQTCLVLNNSLAAYEQAAGDVAWLARTNFGVKVVWAGVVLATVVELRSGLAVAIAGALVEALRFGWMLSRGLRRHGFGLRPDLRLAGAAIVTSLPFFVHLLAHSLYARLGIGWLGAIGTDVEVGLFGAAATFAGVALLGMPLLTWVLVPSAARADAQGDLDGLVAGALRTSLLAAVPMAFLFHLFAADLLGVAFGDGFRPAAATLQLLAPTFALAYVSTVCAIVLLQRGRVRLVATISIAGLVLTAAIDAVAIPRLMAEGAALATLLTEIVVTTALAASARLPWSRHQLGRTAIALAAASVIGGMVHALWPAQIPAAVLSFLGVLVSAGGVTWEDAGFIRRVLVRQVPAASEVA